MFVALSKFVVANGMTEQVKQAFQNRPHLVENTPGFVRLDVISPVENPDEVWLITYWTDQESYEVWHRSPEHHQSHQGIPKGLKLVPKANEIRFFEYVCS
jgi:heme oxygenase (mycobilin-producing)